MYKQICLASTIFCGLGTANAVVVVNGVLGEDGDNASPFETLQAAVNFANAGPETVIEIQTNGPIGGASVGGLGLTHPLTIQAGAGFKPVITSGLDLIPLNSTELISLRGLNVSTTALGTPLIVGCSITAEDCIFNANPAGGGNYGPAVTAAVLSPGTTGVLTLTSCTLVGHVGLQAGRSCREYNVTRCEVIGLPTDLPPVFSFGISNNMNHFSSFGFRMDADDGVVEISEPRTVSISESVVRGGIPLAWPTNTLPDSFYTSETATIGPINAVNTVFEALNINAAGEASRIGHPLLPPDQNPGSTFHHCTFRSANAFGQFYFPGGQPATYNFSNVLFDCPASNYGILTHANATLTGDANTYNTPGGVELFPPGTPKFEATQHAYLTPLGTDPTLTNRNGTLVINHAEVVSRALPLVPPVLIDKDGNPRPMPVTALRPDIGADEVDETAPAGVADWTVY